MIAVQGAVTVRFLGDVDDIDTDRNAPARAVSCPARVEMGASRACFWSRDTYNPNKRLWPINGPKHRTGFGDFDEEMSQSLAAADG